MFNDKVFACVCMCLCMYVCMFVQVIIWKGSGADWNKVFEFSEHKSSGKGSSNQVCPSQCRMCLCHPLALKTWSALCNMSFFL